MRTFLKFTVNFFDIISNHIHNISLVTAKHDGYLRSGSWKEKQILYRKMIEKCPQHQFLWRMEGSKIVQREKCNLEGINPIPRSLGEFWRWIITRKLPALRQKGWTFRLYITSHWICASTLGKSTNLGWVVLFSWGQFLKMESTENCYSPIFLAGRGMSVLVLKDEYMWSIITSTTGVKNMVLETNYVVLSTASILYYAWIWVS